jgi:uncharacterized protein (DUF697 family)
MAQDQEKPALDPRAAAAAGIIKTHSVAAIATRVLPITALIGSAALVGIQLRMLSRLARLYEVDFSEQRAKSIVGSLLGASATGTAMSLLSVVPGLGLLGAIAIPSGATYALGKVFTEHFASGGTFLTFDMERGKKALAERMDDKSDDQSYAGIKP